MPGNQKEGQESDIIDFMVMNFKGYILFHHVDAISKKLFLFLLGKVTSRLILFYVVTYVCLYDFASLEPCLEWNITAFMTPNYIFIDFFSKNDFSLCNLTDSICVCLFDHYLRLYC